MVFSTSQKRKSSDIHDKTEAEADDEPEPEEEVIRNPLFIFLTNAPPNEHQVLDQDKVYKDLNKRFYEKGTEHEFASYKRAIEKIAEKSSKPPASFHMGMFHSSPEVVKIHETRKVIQYFARQQSFLHGITKNTAIIIRVVMSIFKNTKHNTLYKMYTLANYNSQLTMEQLKCVFYNEIYYQEKAHEIASSDHRFIVPRIHNYFSFVDQAGELNLVVEMDFVNMIMVSDVLTPGNAEKYFKSIVDAVDKLNSAGIHHNDLSPDNLQVSRENKEKIVIIDFGQASNETNVHGTDSKYLFFNSRPTTTMDYKSFVGWATEHGKFPLAMSQKHESPISPNKSHKSSKLESPNKSHKSSKLESPNKSHKSSRRESPKSSRKRSLTGGKKQSKTKKRRSSFLTGRCQKIKLK